MNVLEVLKVMDIVEGFIRITERLRTHYITEEIYKDEIKPILMSTRSFLNSVRFDLEDNGGIIHDSFEWIQLKSEGITIDELLRESIELLEKEIVQKNSKQSLQE